MHRLHGAIRITAFTRIAIVLYALEILKDTYTYPYCTAVARLLGEQGQRSCQVVAPLFAEHFEQVGRPAHAARTGNARFVGEKPLDDRAQLLAEGLFVTFQGDAEEFFGDASIGTPR